MGRDEEDHDQEGHCHIVWAEFRYAVVRQEPVPVVALNAVFFEQDPGRGNAHGARQANDDWQIAKS